MQTALGRGDVERRTWVKACAIHEAMRRSILLFRGCFISFWQRDRAGERASSMAALLVTAIGPIFKFLTNQSRNLDSFTTVIVDGQRACRGDS